MVLVECPFLDLCLENRGDELSLEHGRAMQPAHAGLLKGMLLRIENSLILIANRRQASDPALILLARTIYSNFHKQFVRTDLFEQPGGPEQWVLVELVGADVGRRICPHNRYSNITIWVNRTARIALSP
jgi:hypothetical protein